MSGLVRYENIFIILWKNAISYYNVGVEVVISKVVGLAQWTIENSPNLVALAGRYKVWCSLERIGGLAVDVWKWTLKIDFSGSSSFPQMRGSQFCKI
jgi:hypothetical protein